MPAPVWMTDAQRARWDAVAGSLDRDVRPGIDAQHLTAFVLAQERYQVAAEKQADMDAASPLPLLTKANGRAAASPYLGIMDRASGEMGKAAAALGARVVMRPAAFGAVPNDPGAALPLMPELEQQAAPPADEGEGEQGEIGSVTKHELALILGITKPTLNSWIDRYGSAFPMIERGTNGRGYRFDPHAVVEYLRGRQEDQAQKRAERDEQLAQLMLPLASAPSPGDAPLSLEDQIKAERLNLSRIENARRAGSLVPAVEIEAEQMAFLSALSRNLQAWGRQFGRTHGWPEGLVREIEASIAALQRATVREHLAKAAEDRPEELKLAI
ncbi:MAG: hypothetical protein ACRYGR_00710 [Janthinobacterium lividum]